MLKKIICGLLIVLSFSVCLKNSNSSTTTCNFDPCSYKAPEAETQAVKHYLDSVGITNATLHCSGLYYKVDNPGSGATPTVCSNVNVTYKGYLTNGSVFDQNTADLGLYNVILGWSIGIPLVKQGGIIHLYIPPSLGYGASGRAPQIPGNAILIFDVTLNTVY
jgi:FKBP-type peptidyl-prolyl cis-trans isomerase FkpA